MGIKGCEWVETHKDKIKRELVTCPLELVIHIESSSAR